MPRSFGLPLIVTVALLLVAAVVGAFSVSVPRAAAQDSPAGFVETASISPSGKEYRIGWDLPSSGPDSSNRWSVQSRESFSFENSKYDGGMRTLIHINDSTAPQEFEFPLSLPDGVEVVRLNEGGFALFEGDVLVATISAPWAHDVEGNPVHTEIAIENGVLTQRVEHHSGVSYPIVADPEVDWGWNQTTIRLDKRETQATGGVSGAGALAALPWLAVIGVSGPVGLAIIGAAGKLAFDALRAHRNGRCLGIIVNPNPFSLNGGVSSFEYTGGSCR